VYDDAQRMLKEMVASGSVQAHAVVAFYHAASVGDDVQVYGEEGQLLGTLHGLRQQVSVALKLCSRSVNVLLLSFNIVEVYTCTCTVITMDIFPLRH